MLTPSTLNAPDCVSAAGGAGAGAVFAIAGARDAECSAGGGTGSGGGCAAAACLGTILATGGAATGGAAGAATGAGFDPAGADVVPTPPATVVAGARSFPLAALLAGCACILSR
jgi:hypothetical protein